MITVKGRAAFVNPIIIHSPDPLRLLGKIGAPFAHISSTSHGAMSCVAKCAVFPSSLSSSSHSKASASSGLSEPSMTALLAGSYYTPYDLCMTPPGALTASVLLCDYAQVWQGKLFISGAGVGLVGVPAEPPHMINIHAATVVTVPWNAHNQPHRLTIGLYGQDEELVPLSNIVSGPGADPGDEGMIVAQFNAGRAPHMVSGDESVLPVATPISAALPRLDSYHVVVKVDGSELARATFRVLNVPNIQVMG